MKTELTVTDLIPHPVSLEEAAEARGMPPSAFSRLVTELSEEGVFRQGM